jgi:RimJ/RimL family protein N-acetyltransferase
VDPLIGPSSAAGTSVAAEPSGERVLLSTVRLLLCDWSADDAAVLLALSRDPEVMRYFPGPAAPEQIEQLVARQQEALSAGRPGLYAVHTRASEPGGSRCLGFVGLTVPRFEAPFMVPGTTCVEIGWRLRRDAWGRGYATEAAREALRHGFEDLGLGEIVSFTAVANEPSRAVMRRLGMRHDAAGDFDHPVLTPGHPLERHVLYRLTAEEWRRSRHGSTVRD